MEAQLSRRDFIAGLTVAGMTGGALGGQLFVNEAGANPGPAAAPFPSLDHPRFMRRAIEQAKKVPHVPFGAVIVRGTTGEEVGAGYNRFGENPTFHGELEAINRCAAEHPGVDWSQLVLYTTAEPCPMCQAAVEWAGIAMTVYGSSVPFLRKLGWWCIDIRAEEVIRRTPFRRTAILG
jgi:tRNA(Arg) A34 adenosine deaminase TadA